MKTCIALPLERLSTAVQEFTQRPEVRILHVAVDGHLRSGALRLVLAAEHMAQNRSPFLGIDVRGSAPDWAGLEPGLVQAHRKLREARAPLGEITPEIEGRGAGRFAARLVQCKASVREPASGLVLLLVSDAADLELPWLTELQRMALDPTLDEVRFILVSDTGETAWQWSDELLPKDRSMNHRCVVDPEAAARELESEIEVHGGGKRGVGPTDEHPPPSAGGELPELPVVDTKAKPSARPSPAAASEAAPHPETVEICVKRAVLAMQRKDAPQAIEHQARARDLCIRDGRREDAVRMELVLGGYLLDLKQTKQAQASFARAAGMAAEIGAHGLQAQAHYAEAFVWQQERQVDAALRAQWSGIDAAKRGGQPKLAFDGYWDAGCLLRALERQDSVVSLWTDALGYANTLPPSDLAGTRLPEIAKELSAVLRGMRRPSDALAIDEWAARTLG
ncbi:MAG: hypothetical protein KDK70_23325 [Myxococcales bacterium]|nr:hypothetical protein [Myxococcales bacterium]